MNCPWQLSWTALCLKCCVGFVVILIVKFGCWPVIWTVTFGKTRMKFLLFVLVMLNINRKGYSHAASSFATVLQFHVAVGLIFQSVWGNFKAEEIVVLYFIPKRLGNKPQIVV